MNTINCECKHEQVGGFDIYVFHLPAEKSAGNVKADVFASAVLDCGYTLSGSEISSKCYDAIERMGRAIVAEQEAQKAIERLTSTQLDALKKFLTTQQ